MNGNKQKKRRVKLPPTTEQQIRRRTFRAFTIFFLLLGAGWLLFMRLYHEDKDAGVQKTLRKGLEFNESLLTSIFTQARISKEYTLADAMKKVRVNGNIGLGNDADTVGWKLKVIRAAGDTLFLSMDDIKALPRTEVIFDFKCIEGWSQVTHWAGVRFSDFVKAYHLEAQAQEAYIGLQTPDKGYYVGIDRNSIMHKQTILCYEMNGKPLPMDQGYPLRLIIPVKYGIKHLKRIGTLYFSNSKPPDYWAEQGYDYYSGL